MKFLKNHKWGAAALAAVFMGLLLLAGCNSSKADQVDLYWNVDRAGYMGKNVSRNADSEGRFRIRVAVNGEQIDVFTKDLSLCKYIDTMDVMSLELDEEGNISAVHHVDDCTGGFVARNCYVQQVEGNTLTINSNGNYTAFTRTITLPEEAKIYLTGGGILTGIETTVAVDDKISVIADTDGNITHVYVEPLKEVGDIYWNVTKKYDSVTKTTTRQQDVTGCYNYELAHNGEIVNVRTRSAEVANAMDGATAKLMGLEFDEEGYVSGVIKSTTVTGGKSLASWDYVTDIDSDGTIHFERKTNDKNFGRISSGVPVRDCPVYDVSGVGEYVGVPTEVRVGDQVHCLLNARGRICMIFVVGGRQSDSPVYWNVNRDWNKTTLSTNRKPDKDGWYHFTMAVNGKHVKVKTNKLDIANAIEQPVACALKLDGDVVLAAFSADRAAITGGGVFASWYEVSAVKGGQVYTFRPQDPSLKQNAKLATDCQIYDVSSNAMLEGEKTTTVLVGDRVHGFKNKNGEIAVLYIVGRTPAGPTYWNVKREYNSATGVSKRERAEDGYFYITLAVNGEQKVYKTKSQSIINDMDSKTCMTLKVSGDTILKVNTVVSVSHTSGGLWGTYYTVTAIDGNKVTATNGTKTITASYGSNCEIYDVSATAELVGQKTTLRVGDKIHAMLNKSKKLSVIYVTSTTNHDPHTCQCCGEDVTWVAWNGTDKFTKDGHYCIGGNATIAASYGEGVTSVTLCLNGMSLSATKRALGSVPEGVTLNIVDCKGTGNIHGKSGETAPIAMVTGGVLNIYGGTFTADPITADNKSGGLFNMTGGELNLYDGTLKGGKATGNGGNISISKGTLSIFGGQILGGEAATYGGNIAMTTSNANVVIENGQITDGIAGTHGGNIGMGYGSLTMTDTVLSGGSCTTEGGNMSVMNTAKATIIGGEITGGKSGIIFASTGTLTLGGNVQITGNTAYNLKYTGAGQLQLSSETALSGANIGITASTGVILSDITKSQADQFTADEGAEPIAFTEGPDGKGVLEVVVPVVGHTHCYCIGAEKKPTGHTCDDDTLWQPLTAAAMEPGGHYYLEEGTGTLNRSFAMPASGEVFLCLNGQNITNTNRIFGTVPSGVILHICDCTEEAENWGTVIGGTNNNAAVAQISGGTVNLYSGRFTANEITASNKNGGLFVLMSAGNLNVYGGEITGGKTTGNGGNVNVSSGIMNLYGGKVTNGTSGSGKYGGNIAVTASTGTLNIYGGEISGGTAGSHGGNVGMGVGAMVMEGGLITAGTAGTSGGNISVNNASTVTLAGGQITGGTASTSAYSVYVTNNNVLVGGSVQVNDLHMKSGCTFGFLSANALTGVVRVTVETVTAAIANSAVDYTANVLCNNSGYEFVYDSGTGELKPQAKA